MRKTKIMTTRDYVAKHQLNVSDKFDHAEFIKDLKRDFNKLITADIRKNGLITEKRFKNNVYFIKQKFDSVNNKTTGVISDKLFNYFYANVVVNKYNAFFNREV